MMICNCREKEDSVMPDVKKSYNLDPMADIDNKYNPSMPTAKSTTDMPEWKKHIIGGARGSYGKKTTMSILDQRESLPIHKLKVRTVILGTRILMLTA